MKLDTFITYLYIGIILAVVIATSCTFFNLSKTALAFLFLAMGLFVVTLLLSFVNMVQSCKKKKV